jgi:hypothetical protein
MTYPKKMKLEVQIEVDMPLDIIEDKHRFSFRINTVTFKT